MKKNRCCVMIYNSFMDPLIQNLMLTYMRTLAANTTWHFDLITFEQPAYPLKENFETLKTRLASEKIYWHPRRHHTGGLLVLKKLFDFTSVFFLLLRLRLSSTKVIWSYANIAASISWVYSKTLGFKTIITTYEPHSDFMAEVGDWKKESMRYKLLHFLENKAGDDADYLMTGTDYMVNKMRMRKKHGRAIKGTTGVDENFFQFDASAFQWVKQRHGFNDGDKIILYVGKFGSLYYRQETFELFKIMSERLSLPLRFVVATPDSRDTVMELCAKAGFDFGKVVYLHSISADEVRKYNSASHLGISAIPPTPSQKYRSPTKVAEYLLCGLPFITCRGVSEDDVVVERDQVGVVLPDFSRASINDAIPKIADVLKADKGEMAARCRKSGLGYRSKSALDAVFAEIFKELEQP